MTWPPSSRLRRPWLLMLYPSLWRRRYGDEVAELLADRGVSFRTAVDLVAGAIDVWLHPAATMAAASAAQSPEQEKTVLNRIMRLDCAGAYGPNLAKADAWRAGSVMIGVTLALTGIWMGAHIRYGDNPYIDALGVMPFLIGMLASMRYTYLKGRPNSVQAVFIVGFSVVLAALMLGAGWMASRL